MKVSILKEEMHHAIDIIEDADFLNAINLLLNEKSREYAYELTDEEKLELDSLRELHKNGESKSYSVAEVREQAFARLKK